MRGELGRFDDWHFDTRGRNEIAHNFEGIVKLVDLLGEVLGVLGPSGAGKSTVLHLIAGFLAPTRGIVLYRGREVAGPGPERGVVHMALGAVLHACDDPSVPWHRIVRADGSLAKGSRQRKLLLAEGVPFRGERVVMRVARLPEA